MPEWSLLCVVFLFGLAVGSFLNVVIHRTPRGENIVWPGSRCPRCGESLRWHHNIPLLSWFILGGKCAFCGERISFRYPLIELLNALLWVILWIKVGYLSEFLFVAATFSALLALTAIDFEYYAVPDSVNLFALGSALLAAAAHSWHTGQWDTVLHAVRDAAFAAGGLWLLAWLLSKALRKETMGGADVIVAGTMAALLGLPGFFVALFLAALFAVIPSLFAKDTMVPFVPFLSLGTWVVYLYDRPVHTWLERLIYG